MGIIDQKAKNVYKKPKPFVNEVQNAITEKKALFVKRIMTNFLQEDDRDELLLSNVINAFVDELVLPESLTKIAESFQENVFTSDALYESTISDIATDIDFGFEKTYETMLEESLTSDNSYLFNMFASQTKASLLTENEFEKVSSSAIQKSNIVITKISYVLEVLGLNLKPSVDSEMLNENFVTPMFNYFGITELELN